MKSYPMIFKVQSKASSSTREAWNVGADSSTAPIGLAIPPEFDGPGQAYSPEDLYALALQNCFVATFKVYAEKSKFKFQEIAIDSELAVDRNDKGQVLMSRISFVVQLSGVEQPESADRLLNKVSQNCMILNSVITEKSFSFKVVDQIQ